jgi:hypothetical protein
MLSFLHVTKLMILYRYERQNLSISSSSPAAWNFPFLRIRPSHHLSTLCGSPRQLPMPCVAVNPLDCKSQSIRIPQQHLTLQIVDRITHTHTHTHTHARTHARTHTHRRSLLICTHPGDSLCGNPQLSLKPVQLLAITL